MNTRQENKLSMYVSVQSLLEGNNNIWQTLPAFGSAFTAFKGSIQRINSLEQSRQVGTKGVTAAKQAARQAMGVNGVDRGRRRARVCVGEQRSAVAGERGCFVQRYSAGT